MSRNIVQCNNIHRRCTYLTRVCFFSALWFSEHVQITKRTCKRESSNLMNLLIYFKFTSNDCITTTKSTDVLVSLFNANTINKQLISLHGNKIYLIIISHFENELHKNIFYPMSLQLHHCKFNKSHSKMYVVHLR